MLKNRKGVNCVVHYSKLIQTLSGTEVQDFIEAHSDQDPSALALKYREVAGIPFAEIASQIKSRQKAKYKLPSWYQTKALVYPPAISMEQCSGELTATYKSNLLPEGCSLADLTGGFGVDSFFFSGRAAYVRYVERQEILCEIARHNFSVFKKENIRVHHSDLKDYLPEWLERPTDYVYLDPARRDGRQKKVFLLEDCEPDLHNLLPELLPHCQGVMVKLSPLFDIHLLLREYGTKIQHIHVISVKNECRELLVNFSKEPEEGGITCVNLLQEKEGVTFQFEELQKKVVPEYSAPLKYLYEPNASVLKGGVYDNVGKKCNLKKLQRHSHLYTSTEPVSDFPGRTFEIVAVCGVDKKELASLIPEKKANISTRNFPLSPEELSKKLGFKDGGTYYLFGTTLIDGEKVVIVGVKVP